MSRRVSRGLVAWIGLCLVAGLLGAALQLAHSDQPLARRLTVWGVIVVWQTVIGVLLVARAVRRGA